MIEHTYIELSDFKRLMFNHHYFIDLWDFTSMITGTSLIPMFESLAEELIVSGIANVLRKTLEDLEQGRIS